MAAGSRQEPRPHPPPDPVRGPSPGPAPENRRRAPRYALPVRVEYGSGAPGTAYGIGPGGVFVRTPEPLRPGSDLELTLHLPGEPRLVRARGRVVWANLVDTPSLPAGMGIRFLRIDPADRVRLERRLRALV